MKLSDGHIPDHLGKHYGGCMEQPLQGYVSLHVIVYIKINNIVKQLLLLLQADSIAT